MNKSLLLAISLLILFVILNIFLFWRLSLSKSKLAKSIPLLNQENSLDKCVEEMGAENLDYTPGSVLVVFRSTIKRDTAIGILGEYGLSPKSDDIVLPPNLWWGYVPVVVPEGSEIEWVCKFNKDIRIDHSTLNIIIRNALD